MVTYLISPILIKRRQTLYALLKWGGTLHGLIKKDANYIILIPGKKAGYLCLTRMENTHE